MEVSKQIKYPRRCDYFVDELGNGEDEIQGYVGCGLNLWDK